MDNISKLISIMKDSIEGTTSTIDVLSKDNDQRLIKAMARLEAYEEVLNLVLKMKSEQDS